MTCGTMPPGLKHLRGAYWKELLQMGSRCQWMILGNSEIPCEPYEVEMLLRQNIPGAVGKLSDGENYMRHRVRYVLWEWILDEQNSLWKGDEGRLNELVRWWIPFESSESILRKFVLSRKLHRYPATRQMALQRGWDECCADWMGDNEKVALWIDMLQEYHRHCPEYVLPLKQKWLDMVQSHAGGMAWQAGWLGLAVSGEGQYDAILAGIMEEKLDMQSAAGQENLHEWTEQARIMVKWRPENPALRREIQQRWEQWGEMTGLWPWAWEAVFRLEDDEEKLFQQLQSTSAPWMLLAQMEIWEPRNAEVRRRAGRFWHDLLRSGKVDNPAAKKITWQNLLRLAPHDVNLTGLLETFLPVEEDQHVLEVIAHWIEKYGLPPETPEQIRQQLLESMANRISFLESNEKNWYTGEFLTVITFHLLMCSVQPETASEAEEQWGRVAPGIGKASLPAVTWWYKRMLPEKRRPWRRLIQKSWERQLMDGDSLERKNALYYLLWMSREDDLVSMDSMDNELWPCLMRLLQEEKNADMYLATVLLAKSLVRQKSGCRGNRSGLEMLWKGLCGRQSEIYVRGIPLTRFFRRQFLLERIEECLSGMDGEKVTQSGLFRLLRALTHVFPMNDNCNPVNEKLNQEILLSMGIHEEYRNGMYQNQGEGEEDDGFQEKDEDDNAISPWIRPGTVLI